MYRVPHCDQRIRKNIGSQLTYSTYLHQSTTLRLRQHTFIKVIFERFEAFGIRYLPTVMVHYDVRMIML